MTELSLSSNPPAGICDGRRRIERKLDFLLGGLPAIAALGAIGGAKAAIVAGCVLTRAGSLLSLLDAETAHKFGIWAAKYRLLPRDSRPDPPSLATNVWGRQFVNPLGENLKSSSSGSRLNLETSLQHCQLKSSEELVRLKTILSFKSNNEMINEHSYKQQSRIMSEESLLPIKSENFCQREASTGQMAIVQALKTLQINEDKSRLLKQYSKINDM